MRFSPRSFFILTAIIAIIGVFNAGYLSWVAVTGAAPTCFLNSGCDVVAASPFSKVFDIPLASFGVFFYAMIFGFSLWKVLVPATPVLRYLLPLASLGFLLSLYFLYLQAFVIGAYCEYCLFSLFDATVIFLVSLYLWLKGKEQVTMEEEHGSI